MLIKAPAKINLTLKILSKRADGYHEISSMMRTIRLFDEVEIDARTFDVDTPDRTIYVKTDADGIPEGSGNLAYRAAALMAGKYPGLLRKIEISIKKSIPVAAGLGGGSADAAAVLLYLAKMLDEGVMLADIAALGTEIGMDVPFCVYACAAANPELGFEGAASAMAEGAGEIITPIVAPEKAWIVLVSPQVEVPTKQVYELYDTRRDFDHTSENDLEAPCAEAWPVVAESIAKLKSICPDDVKVQLSGSGPSVFAYIKDSQKTAAERVLKQAKEAFKDVPVRLIETL